MVNSVGSKHEFSLTQAEAGEDIATARSLFEEYQSGLGISLCFQNFDHELATLPGDYAPPSGRLLIARDGDVVAGCIALRRMTDEICEMKRLYLRPEHRGKGLGRVLVDAILSEAIQIGYQRMRLDTLPGRMDQAIALYRSIGFKEVAPYPAPETLYMELTLADG